MHELGAQFTFAASAIEWGQMRRATLLLASLSHPRTSIFVVMAVCAAPQATVQTYRPLVTRERTRVGDVTSPRTSAPSPNRPLFPLPHVNTRPGGGWRRTPNKQGRWMHPLKRVTMTPAWIRRSTRHGARAQPHQNHSRVPSGRRAHPQSPCSLTLCHLPSMLTTAVWL